MKTVTFIFIVFIVTVFADITLNDLAREPLSKYTTSPIILALRPYFQKKSILVAGIYAGITIVIALLVSMFFYNYIQHTLIPRNWRELAIFMAISFPIGYVFDVFIAEFDIFGVSLQPYYKATAPGLLGAIAFEVAILVGFIIHKYILPIL